MKRKKSVSVVLVALLVLSMTMTFGTPSVTAQTTYVSVINPETGDGNFTYSTADPPPPGGIVVNITVTNVTRLNSWQVNLTWDPTLLQIANSTDVYTPTDHVFNGLNPIFFAKYIDNTNGSVFWGCAIGPGAPVNNFNGSGRLMCIRFTVNKTPTGSEPLLSCNLVIDTVSAFPTRLLNPEVEDIPFTEQNGYYEYSWSPPPPPHLEVFPTLIEYGPSPAVGEEFDINILIKDLAEEWRLVGIQFRLGYNNTLLEVVSVTEGPFLKDPKWNWYGTSFFSSVEPDGTYGPHVVVGDLLLPNATGHYDQTEFPNGDGTVATIRFRIIYQGVFPEVDISYLNLYDIGLIDKDSNPIPYDPPANGIVKIFGEYHDIAITDVSPSKTIVSQGYNITIHATTQNQGNFTETFIVWTFCGFHKNVTLYAGASTTVSYTFDTSKLTRGNYRLWAYATPCFGDHDPYNNIYVDGWILVTIPGDINGDRLVDIVDLVLVIRHYGSYPGHPDWNPNADINSDGKVDIVDLVLVIKHYGTADL